MKIRLLLCLMLCLGQSVAWATRTRVPPFHQESWLIEEWYRDYEAARADCDAFAANLGYPGQCAGFGGGLIHGVPVGVVWGGNFCHYGPNWWECQQPHIWELGRFYYDYPFEKNVGPDCPGPCTPNPINIGNGNKHLREVDFRGGGAPPLEFSRTYNSLAWTEDGSLGAKWLSNYARWLDPLHLGTRLRVRAFRPTGKSFGFQFLNGTYVADADVNDRLTHTTAGDGTITAWQYRVASDDSLETYRPDGKLASIAARNGLMQVLQYGILPTPDGPTAQAELLVRVTDSFGRELSFAYDTAGRLAALTDSLGHHYGYGYDAQGDLVSVSYPDGGTRQYLYNEADYTSGANLPHALTGVIDENGSRFATYRYDSDGRAVSSELAGGVARYALSYPDPVRSSVVTDPLGTQRTYQFQNILGRLSNTSVAQPAGAGSPAATQTTSFDAHGNISARTDFKGTSTTYQHDPVRNLETSRTEAAGTPAARSTSTQWHALYRLPTRISEPVSGGSRVTEFSYDASGNLLTKTITAPNGLGGSETRTWHTTYNGFGQVLSVDGPRGDVADLASYTYYASTDPSGNYRLGDLATSSNALGQTTVYQAYDAAGRLLKTIDPNGLETRLTYTPRGWLASRAVGTAAEGFATTSYTYDAAGQLLTVTLPEGSTLHYQYDPAHRLTEVRDGTGNRLRYTLDALGNRIKEEAFDPQGALARTRSRAFDALARLAQEWGASTAARTVYGYDANGNLTSSTDPLGHLTTRQYDAFNRLIGLTDPLAGQVLYQYSPDHQLTALTDPLARSTTFAHNGFGEVLAEDSPDRGATQYRYLAGQLLSKTDARGEVVQFQYDALNRLSRSTFSDQT
ncbi:MAG: RHS repeat protein, partial [Betaproteobacteria bacterium]|nr:RHS repeat protein [Betaproteobacteria bacterium]